MGRTGGYFSKLDRDTRRALLHFLDSWLLDEDTLVSDSATHIATQQSIKAYVDSSSAALLLDEDDMSSDSATKAATQQSVKAYSDSGTQTLTNKTLNDFSNDVHADDLHLRARNTSGGVIGAGTPVYVSGYNVGNDLPEIAKADASSSSTMPAIGLTSGSINNNANGEIILAGIVSSIDTSSFSAGDVVYVSTTAGTLTATKPTGSDLVQEMGEVTKSNASTGKIDVLNEPVPYVTGFAATLLDDGDASTARTTLGLSNLDESWTSFTPTWGNFAPGGTQEWYYRYTLGFLEVHGFSSLTGADVSGAVTMTLPNSETFRTVGEQFLPVGQALYQDQGSRQHAGVVLYASSTTVKFRTINTTFSHASMSDLSATVPHTWANTDDLGAQFRIPI